MSLPQFATKNSQVTIVTFLLLLILGMQAFLEVPQYESPLVQPPGGIIIAIYPGASPSDMESLVVNPIEEAIYELDDLKKMDADIQSGLAVIDVEFAFGTDADEKFDDILSQVSSVENELPADLYGLDVRKKSTSDAAIYQIMMVGEEVAYSVLEEEAEKLKDAIEGVSGLKEVKIEAYPEQQVRIALDPIKMEAAHISLDDIERAIQSSNANIPGGNLKVSNKQFIVQTSGFYQNLSEIKRTVVGTSQGKNVYLENIAQVYFTYEDERYLARVNGRRSLTISIQQNENVNVHDVSKEIRKRIAQLTFPAEIELVYVFEQTKQVEENVNSFLSNLIQGIVLVGIIIWLVLGGRPAILVMVAIPLSILIAIVVINQLDLGLQQVSIAGLVIALGLLVDNSIVITENIERYLNMGESKMAAAVKGSSELGSALISATLTTCLAFTPIITMPDKTGDFIRSMPITVIAALVASLFIAFTLTPFVAARLFKEGQHRKVTWLAKQLQRFANGGYARYQTWIFRHKGLTIVTALTLFIAALLIFALFIDRSFFPKAQKAQFRIIATLPPGSNLEATDTVTRKIERVLDTIPSISYYVANVGHGNPRIYYNVPSQNFRANFAEVFVSLQEYDETAFDQLITRLRRTFTTYGEAQIDVKEYTQGPVSDAPITIKIYGDNLARLRELSLLVEQRLRAHPAAINVSNELGRSAIDLKLTIYREKAAMLGVPIVNIDKAVRTFLAGRTVSYYRDDENNEYGIVLRYDHIDGRFSYEDFERIQIESLSGSFIPLLNLTSIDFIEGESAIEHTLNERTVSVFADLADGYVLKEVIDQLEEDLEEIRWDGYDYAFAGDLTAQQDSFGGLANATVFALLLCLLVLIVQFRSFLQPLIVFTALPFGLIGAVLLMFVFNETFSFMAFVGLISLIGIAINNSIVLVEFANQELKEGKSVQEAAIEGGKIRLVPIISTTLTTILGLIPLTIFGGSLWRPMGLVIIGGMVTSTVLILLIVPLIYTLFTKASNKIPEE